MSDKVIIDFSEFANRGVGASPPASTPRRKLLKRTQPLPGMVTVAPHIPTAQLLDPEIQDMLSTPLVVPILQHFDQVKAKFDPIEKEINLLKRYRKNPLFFVRDELGIPIEAWRDDKPPKSWSPGNPVPLWSKQREILQALVDHRKVAVKSGHGVGKTFIAGLSAIYLAYVWHCVGLTTAPTFRQVRRALWGEIHWMFNNAKNPLGGKMNQVSLDLGDKWFVEGFATDKPMENITGIHEENIFVIVDEAGGVPDLTFEAIEGILTSENSFVLYIGNPINAEGPFADAFKPNSPFHKVTISCYDCPNVKYNSNIYSKLTSYKWVKEKEVKWGINTNMFKVRVAGEFPDENKDTLIPMRYIESAQRRGQEGVMIPDRIIGFGLDVARQGSDSSVFGARYESGLFRILDVTNKKRETETAGQMKVLYNQLAPPLLKYVADVEKMLGVNPNKIKEEQEKDSIIPPINVDDIGVGGGVVDMLVEDDYPVNGINVGEKPDPFEDVSEKPELFLNKRAQYFWKLRTMFMNEKVAIEDDELAFELSKIRVEFLRSGKIKIIDKDALKKAPPEGIGRSPDRAECMMLTYSREVSETSLEMVRFI
jgi:phage terminase large subunit